MDKSLNTSLYEQLIYSLIKQIQGMKIDFAGQEERALRSGQQFGLRALFSFGKIQPFSSSPLVSSILGVISSTFWFYVFGTTPIEVLYSNTQTISFKDSGFAWLRRVDEEANKGIKDPFVELMKKFIEGAISGVLKYFKHDSEVKVSYSLEVLSVQIICHN